MMTFMSQSGMERSALRRSSLSIYQSMMMAEAQVTIMMIMIVIMMIHDLGISNGQMVKSPQAGSGWMHDVLRENLHFMASLPTEI